MPGFRSLLLILAVAAAVAGDIIALIMHRVPWPYEPIWRTLPLSLSLSLSLVCCVLYYSLKTQRRIIYHLYLLCWGCGLLASCAPSCARYPVPMAYGHLPISPERPPFRLPISSCCSFVSRRGHGCLHMPDAPCSWISLSSLLFSNHEARVALI